VLKAHVEITIRLPSCRSRTLHEVLGEFATATRGWEFPAEKSCDHERHHREGYAGFVVSHSIKGLEQAAVAVAQKSRRRPTTFHVPNIVPRSCSMLTLDQYKLLVVDPAMIFRPSCGNRNTTVPSA
jgi:hypothetical protein